MKGIDDTDGASGGIEVAIGRYLGTAIAVAVMVTLVYALVAGR